MTKGNDNDLVAIDGRTGEGGGQLVRVAISLSALTGRPIRITNVRGNRPAPRKLKGKTVLGGGLKPQHVSSIAYLAAATNAECTGCEAGSQVVTFTPKLKPAELKDRQIVIKAEGAACTLLVFQALFPFLLFASSPDNKPISLTIHGGTNVGFSLSYEYVDQVLLPSLEKLGVPHVTRELKRRGWSQGRREPWPGEIKFTFTPLSFGQTLDAPLWPKVSTSGKVIKIDVSMIVPQLMHDAVVNSLAFELDNVFPNIETQTVVDEDSQDRSRVFLLLVARTDNGCIFARDWLYDRPTRTTDPDKIATELVEKVVDDLDTEIRKGGTVDEFLDDQLVVFRALAAARSIVYTSEAEKEEDESRDKMSEVNGRGELHAKTARWVTSQLLPETKWFDGGRVCDGIAWKSLGEQPEDLTTRIEDLNITTT